MEEYGVWLDPDTTEMKRILFFSDKVAKNRQQRAQKSQLQQFPRKL